jgi:ATP-dependent DNA ligase
MNNALTIKNYETDLPGKLNGGTYEFPTIRGKNKNGADTYYDIIVRVQRAGEFVEIQPEWFKKGQIPGAIGWIKVNSRIKENGPIKSSVPTLVTSGKNIGKANETNVFTQALRDAMGKYNKQMQKVNPRIETNGAVVLLPPMLAQDLRDQKELPWGKAAMWVQLKRNGVRAVAANDKEQGTIILYSRNRKVYPGLDYLKEQLRVVFDALGELDKHKQFYIDGEIYKHGVDLQVISGDVRAGESKSGIKYEYHVFDIFAADDKSPYTDRLRWMQRAADVVTNKFGEGALVKVVESHAVKSREEVDVFYNAALRDGYEGAIVRIDAPYEYSYNSYHSAYLLKLKPVLDSEFKIIGYTAAAKGKSDGALMIRLATVNGGEFTVNISMPIDERKKFYERMGQVEPNGKTVFENNYLGKMLTVQYDELSSDGVPVRARAPGLVVRDYE